MLPSLLFELTKYLLSSQIIWILINMDSHQNSDNMDAINFLFIWYFSFSSKLYLCPNLPSTLMFKPASDCTGIYEALGLFYPKQDVTLCVFLLKLKLYQCPLLCSMCVVLCSFLYKSANRFIYKRHTRVRNETIFPETVFLGSVFALKPPLCPHLFSLWSAQL